VQLVPEYPVAQVQVYPSTVSWQVPPLAHGIEAHSAQRSKQHTRRREKSVNRPVGSADGVLPWARAASRTIDIGLAQTTAVSGVTNACERVDAIHTIGSPGRCTGRRRAFHNIRFAQPSAIARTTRAREPGAGGGICTGAAVETGRGQTFVDVGLAQASAPTGGADAHEGGGAILTVVSAGD
jgi:hypothetical protein